MLIFRPRVIAIAALLALGGAWYVLLGPTFMGGPATYTIVSGDSMLPYLHSGDLAITVKSPTYETGDVVVYRIPQGDSAAGHQVIHRVTAGDGDNGYETQGDNRDHEDLWRPTNGDVLGRMWFSIPSGGDTLIFVRQPLMLGAIAGLLTAFSLLSFGGGKKKAPVSVPAPAFEAPPPLAEEPAPAPAPRPAPALPRWVAPKLPDLAEFPVWQTRQWSPS